MTDDSNARASKPSRLVRVAMWFLAISYGLGAPMVIFLEMRDATLSEKFGYPPAFMYSISAVQIACVVGIFVRSLAPWAAAALTVITLGAVYSHLRIESPLTAVPGVVYTAIQVWFGWASWRDGRR